MNSLINNAQKIASQAILSGHLNPIQTTCIRARHNEHQFLIHIASNIQKKKQSSPQNKNFNPFLPYEPALFIADIGDQHVCILNKFPVVNDHLLLITRVFEPQENLLTQADFEAMNVLMQQTDGLMFYNSGLDAGASQGHKHMQWVPRSLGEQTDKLPFEPDNVDLPFSHYWQTLECPDAPSAYTAYRCGLDRLGWQQGKAYNLLMTRNWLLLVPRRQASWQDMSINSLAFAGSFFVKNQEQATRLQVADLESVFRSVCGW